MMKAISLFSGAGGFDLGFEKAGMEIVLSNDSWTVATQTYACNRHKTRMLTGSIEKHLSEITAVGKNKKVDVVIGGPPCQDFSSAGWRTGIGKRADMTTLFIKTALKINPEWIVMENVNTITSIGIDHVKRITNMLTKHGYHSISFVLDAVFFGVPQRRKRFFLIARKKDISEIERYIEAEKLRNVVSVAKFYPKITRGKNKTKYYYRHPWSFERRAIFSVHEPSPTIRGVNRPIPPGYKIHENDAINDLNQVRPLTTNERAILQTFPEDYVFVGTKTEREQQIGNAVPPKMAYSIANAILRHG